MKIRITSLLLVLAMCFAMLPTAAFAADDEGSEIPAYSGGSGTQDNPWLISSVEDLQLLANTINNGKAAGFNFCNIIFSFRSSWLSYVAEKRI